jgi:hypothetical protein
LTAAGPRVDAADMAGRQDGDDGDVAVGAAAHGAVGAAGGSVGAPPAGTPETFNPWTVVNLVFHHLAANGLHPVLGGRGDPAVAATALLRELGIEPGRNDESVTSPRVQDQLAAMRAHFFGEGREDAGSPDPDDR